MKKAAQSAANQVGGVISPASYTTVRTVPYTAVHKVKVENALLRKTTDPWHETLVCAQPDSCDWHPRSTKAPGHSNPISAHVPQQYLVE